MAKFILLLFGALCFYISQGQTDTSGNIQTNTLITRDSVIKTDTVVTVSTNTLPITPIPGQGRVYKLKPAIDVPLSLAGSAWTLYAFSKIYDRDPSSIEKIQSLRTNNIPGFDRWAADIYSEKAAEASDLFFYGSMPLPILLMLDKKIRKDAGKIALLYLEAMSVTGVIYSGSSYLTSRYRPYAYNPEAPMDLRIRGGAKNSFFAGHVALVGTSTFFMAKVFSDYHPDSKIKWMPYTIASVATGATAYLRHRGGRHFPSDILIGTALGPLSGILIPHFHKNKNVEDRNFTILPFTGKASGISIVYNFRKKPKTLLKETDLLKEETPTQLNSTYSCKGM
jgi:membrane-associated phospholipid phosphatase